MAVELFFVLFLAANVLRAGEIATSSSNDEIPIVPSTDTGGSRWRLSLGGGVDFSYGLTDFSRSYHFRTRGISFNFINLNLRGHRYDNFFDHVSPRVEGEVSYAISDKLEMWGKFDYATANAHRTNGGFRFLFTGIPGRSGFDFLRSEASDYSSYGVTLGGRYYFLSSRARFRPYIRRARVPFTLRKSTIGSPDRISPLGREDKLFDRAVRRFSITLSTMPVSFIPLH